ncbi:MAG: type II secretion system F family protein [Anaerolineae bacterium]|jgi:tight adherence protein B
MTPVLIGLAVAGAVGLFLLGVSRVLAPSGSLEERIEEWVQDGEGADFDILKEGGEGGSLLGAVDKAVTKQSWAESMKEDLAQADLTLTVTEYLLVRVAAVVILGLVGYLLQRNFLVALILGAVGFAVPPIYIRARQGRRLRAFNGQLPDVLDHLQGSLRAGYGLLQSVEWVSRQMPNPAGMEFDRVVREVQLGRNILDALDSMVRRIPSDDLALIVTAIKIQYEVGGSLAEILEIVAHTIRERVRIQREISVLTAQQRISGYVLMVLPIGMAIFLFVVNPSYIMPMFEPGPILCIPIGTVILMVVGFLIMRRIIDIEV